MISLFELKQIKENVTAIIFSKDEYTIEGIIRWLFDRGFSCDYFEETDKDYVIKQADKKTFRSFEYSKIEGCNITVEVGSGKESAPGVK